MMIEIPMEVLYAAELAKTHARAVAKVVTQGPILQGITVDGVPRGTHLAWTLAVVGFACLGSPDAAPVWVWHPGVRFNRQAN